jgi:REP element-mobilizing transposase RayT
MSRNFYSEIHLHIVWHTKSSAPLLIPEIKSLVHRELRRKLVASPGVYVHEIGGTPTHVHLAVTLAPTIGISELIGQLKGASSHEVNERLGRKAIQWQAGDGVVSFGTKDLPWVVEYIRNQNAHHANGTIVDRLERITTEVGPMAEAPQREAP